VVGSPDLCHLVLQALDARAGSGVAPRYLAALVGKPAGK